MTNDDRALSLPPAKSTDDFDPAKAILRLLIGGLIEGSEELTRRLHAWENAIQAELHHQAELDHLDMSVTNADLVRYALVGLAFEAQERLREETIAAMHRTGDAIQGMVSALRPFTDNFLLRPLQTRIDNTLLKAESDIMRWIQTGYAEELRARLLAREATLSTIDDFINYLSANPELERLVQQQSIGLADEVVDGVRQVSATADDTLEGIVRRLLKLKPRSELPLPATAQRPAAQPTKPTRR